MLSLADKNEPGVQFNYIINFFKTGIFFSCFLLMIYYKNFSLPSLLITLYHGSYGLIWTFKDIVFGDKSFQVKMKYSSAIQVSILLMMYCSMAYFIISDHSYTKISVDRILLSGYLYILGVVLMVSSDAQKNFTLKIKKGLIDNGVFAITRNPNYLGEISLYLSFAILAQRLFCYIFLSSIWIFYFSLRMNTKDDSLKKKEGWAEYSRNSYILLPKFFKKGIINNFIDSLNYVMYISLFVVFVYLYMIGGLFNNFLNNHKINFMFRKLAYL